MKPTRMLVGAVAASVLACSVGAGLVLAPSASAVATVTTTQIN